MKGMIARIQASMAKSKIQRQLNSIYILAILIPIVVLGTFLLATSSNLLSNYHKDIIESDNLRVKTILFEMTSQIYNISEGIVFDEQLQELLTTDYATDAEFRDHVKDFSSMNNYLTNYAEIADIQIYSDMEQESDYLQFYHVTDEVTESDWYKRASSQFSVFWYPMKSVDQYGNEYWRLALVRKIPLMQTGEYAVLVITISDNYLKTRIDNNDYVTLVSTDDGVIFYGTNRMYYGEQQPVEIDYDNIYYRHLGSSSIDGHKYMSSVTALTLYQSDSILFVTTLSADAYTSINRILVICFIIILLAAVLPAIIIQIFTRYFTHRVTALREEMHKASLEEYDMVEILPGDDEIAQAMADLHVMVQNIKEKDSEMYESRINEQTLRNDQQVMEFKMLSSQINPHFLYNTLETIRMKALTEGNPEVATAIKLLGKSLRYVLENTGTSSTTLKNELTYIEIYLIIQRLRFSERVNYEFVIEEGLQLDEYEILPLLLQPIVENAINHGLEEIEEYGRVTITVSTRDDEFLLIDIEDNGLGMDEETLQALITKINTPNMKYKSSIGLYNIAQRIRLFYGDAYGMKIKSRLGKGTTVSLVLPLRNISEDSK